MRTVYLIGVCGTAMATLAVLLKQRGFDVRGSDQQIYPPMSQLLTDNGITFLEGYRSEHISSDLDLVVVGNAISRGNPELEAVLEKRVRYASLPEILRNEFLWNARSVVVAGTHGKTTTAFMLAWTLREAGVDPSFLIGGISRNLGTSGHLGSGDLFVVEGDEYDSAFFDKSAKFLKYLPDVVVVNNIEFDHGDIYRDLEELRVTFRRLVRLLPKNGRLVLNADDPEARALKVEALCKVETVGVETEADWQAVRIKYHTSETSFEVMRQGRPVAHVRMPILGAFNVRNALGSMAAAATVGVAPELTAQALQGFRGVKRRLEIRGVAGEVTVYDDFAHHPTAVRETLSAMRATMPSGNIWALFEPCSATACRQVFQKDFAESLGLADKVVVTEVHRKDIPESERLSEHELVASLTAAGVAARFLPAIDDVVAVVVEDAQPGDQVIVMSNGGFGGIHDRLLAELAER
jgi:UDP-N-acetylmuramate: L-alanyl-gamma-D-glutamyl-meso-diaminopimelate ligase